MKNIIRGVVAAVICFVTLSLVYYWFVGRHYTNAVAPTEITTEEVQPSQPQIEQ